MKHVKQRLQELRSMDYAQYLESPEWLETRRAAIKRAGRCQACQAAGTALDAYHTSDKNRGCEQEDDIVVLCEACYDRLYQLNQQETTNEAEERTPQHFSLAKRAAIFTPAALAGLGLPLLLHAPPPAEIFGLVGAFALAMNSPKIYSEMREYLPSPLVEFLDDATERKQAREASGEWSNLDRLLGRHMRTPQLSSEIKYDPEDEDSQTDKAAYRDEGAEPVFPRYRDDETLRLGQAIDKQALNTLIDAYGRDRKSYAATIVRGRRFDPHVDYLLGSGLIITAVQGSGKSILSGLIVEQAGACDCPAIILDHKGEYAGITELDYLYGVLAGGPNAARKAERMGVPYLQLTPDNVDEFVRKVISERLQAVVSLPSFGDRWIDRATIVSKIGQALMKLSAEQQEQGVPNVPCLIFLDEAQLYIPENVKLLPPEARQNPVILNSLSNAFFALVSNGRSYGYTVCFATQSLTYIAKWAIKSCQIKILMRHAENNDLNMCEEILGGKAGILTRDEIESLPPGVGVVFGFTRKPMLVRFDKRESRDESETPSIQRLRIGATPKIASSEQASTAAQGSRPLQTLDIETITAWFASGHIDENVFLELLKSAKQTETLFANQSKGTENAQEGIIETFSTSGNQRFPVSSKNAFPVSQSGNVGDDREELTETAHSAVPDPIITNLFPASEPGAETPVTREELERLGISQETIRLIKKMKENGTYKDREISEIVELRGRKYESYKKVLTHLGYREKERA